MKDETPRAKISMAEMAESGNGSAGKRGTGDAGKLRSFGGAQAPGRIETKATWQT